VILGFLPLIEENKTPLLKADRDIFIVLLKIF